MKQLAVIGLGPVGLATAVAFAAEGHNVVGVDADKRRVTSIVQGGLPFFEKGLTEYLHSVTREKRFTATTNMRRETARAEIIFLCVGTPSRSDGSMDSSYLEEATKDIAASCGDERRRIVLIKSTVIPGTTETIIRPILEASDSPFGLAVNPEFLREGHTVEDALHPDRVVLGVDGPETATQLRRLYAHVTCPIVETDLRTAEAIKYATNAFLATKVTFANETANICQALGVSYDEVIRSVSLDPRIDPRFLVPGVGFGGSCFPKDVKALVHASKAAGYPAPLMETVLRQNELQYLQAIKLLEEELGDLRGKRIALLGLAFKGNTDDVRESRGIPIARTLLERDVVVVGYDPVANENFHRVVPDVLVVNSLGEALRNADGCLLQADWPDFSRLGREDFLKAMRTPVVVDGRRILEPERMKGIRLRRIG